MSDKVLSTEKDKKKMSSNQPKGEFFKLIINLLFKSSIALFDLTLLSFSQMFGFLGLLHSLVVYHS